MNIKKLLSIAVIAALPFGANAENISGAMYAAPTRADTNHPAPTTNAYAPYGRIDIDTADQDHVASTAYVKGAYNSAIAAINKVDSAKQTQLYLTDTVAPVGGWVLEDTDFLEVLTEEDRAGWLMSGGAIVNTIDYKLNNQRVEVYTNWDDDTDKTEVAFVVASAQE